jgi:hypothetical protein
LFGNPINVYMSWAGIGSAGGRRYSSEADQIQSCICTGEQAGGWLYRQHVARRAVIGMNCQGRISDSEQYAGTVASRIGYRAIWVQENKPEWLTL